MKTKLLKKLRCKYIITREGGLWLVISKSGKCTKFDYTPGAIRFMINSISLNYNYSLRMYISELKQVKRDYFELLQVLNFGLILSNEITDKLNQCMENFKKLGNEKKKYY